MEREIEAGSRSHVLPAPTALCTWGWEAQRPQHHCRTPSWVPGNSRGEGSDRRQQKEVLPDGLWYKPPPSFISLTYSAAGNGGGREEDEAVGGKLTQRRLETTDAINSSR